MSKRRKRGAAERSPTSKQAAAERSSRRTAPGTSSAKASRTDRDPTKVRAAFEAEQQKIKRRRSIFGILGFVPLALSLGCGTGTPLDALCVIPRDVLLLAWAALFGSFLGLTIRLILERRKFERGTTGRPAA